MGCWALIHGVVLVLGDGDPTFLERLGLLDLGSS
jgi:hypothetical protein